MIIAPLVAVDMVFDINMIYRFYQRGDTGNVTASFVCVSLTIAM